MTKFLDYMYITVGVRLFVLNFLSHCVLYMIH
jgi:hypothetical protein